MFNWRSRYKTYRKHVKRSFSVFRDLFQHTDLDLGRLGYVTFNLSTGLIDNFIHLCECMSSEYKE